MTFGRKLIIVGLAVGVFGAAAILKEIKRDGGAPVQDDPHAAALPRLLDLGSDTCIPCKMMAPILEELKKEYEGRMIVEFIDVRRHREIGLQHGVKVIPTQIFFAADGTELFRHQGFMSREDILEKWRELGVNMRSGGSSNGKG